MTVITTPLTELFPRTVTQIQECALQAEHVARQRIAEIVRNKKYTFENTVYALDCIQRDYTATTNALYVLKEASPDEQIRTHATTALQNLINTSIDLFWHNKELYLAIKACNQRDLNKQEKYLLTDLLAGFKRSGLDLDDATRAQVIALEKEIEALCLQFETNIAQADNKISVSLQDLAGVDSDFIKNLEQSAAGYILTTAYPTVQQIMENCQVEKTRKELFISFNQRGYPGNRAVLEQLLAKRRALAQLLGFEHYAALDLDNQMTRNCTRVEQFLAEITERALKKGAQETDFFKKNLPTGVTLENGLFKPWDLAYIKASYKKKHYAVDEQEIAAYFPLEHAIQGLFNIYQTLFNIRLIQKEAQGFWHEDVQLIEVYDNQGLRGSLLLDLHPRAHKYSHACEIDIIKSLKAAAGNAISAVAVVLANFPASTSDRPALLTHADVTTFFHEFGHALHDILAGTPFHLNAGTACKRDFVELPSQMLEEWLYDAQILKKISRHYKTGNTLPDDLIEKKIALKQFDSGHALLRQLFFATVSLEYYKQHVDSHVLARRVHEQLLAHVLYIPDNYFELSFGHLTGYGAKYYGYLWSKVFALDLFYLFKQEGLLNPAIGKRYIDCLLSKGGSADPNELLTNFLGRHPSSAAFFTDAGL